ncbi:MAG: MarR family transcriptional regulator [Clostridiaceae bacterium]
MDFTGNVENTIFSYIDEVKSLFSPDKYSDIFLEYTKNELLALLFLYRYSDANMTQIAEYINAPLNTATGVITRLEKKQMVERIRSTEDRRIVLIKLTSKAKETLEKEKNLIVNYGVKIFALLTDEEKIAAISIYKKVVSVLKEDKVSVDSSKNEKKIKKIIIE